MAFYVLRFAPGPGWVPAVPRRAQPGWAAHAAFMDDLASRGVVLLGGALGEDASLGEALVLVDAADEAAAKAIFAPDPWWDTVLALESVHRWHLFIGAEGVSR